MPRKRRPITNSQKRAAKAAQRARGLDQEAWQELLNNRFGVTSCTELDVAQANDLLDFLNGRHARPPSPNLKKRKAGPKAPRAEPLPPGVVELATPGQRTMIRDLVHEITWSEAGSFEGWLRVNQGLTRVGTKAEASRVIEGLKGLKRHGHALEPRHG